MISEPGPPLLLDPPTFPRRVVSLLTPPPQDYPDSPPPQDLPSRPPPEEPLPSPPPQKMRRLNAMHELALPLSSSNLTTDEILESDEPDEEYCDHDLESDYYCESCFCVPCLCYEADESEQDPFE